MLTSLVVLLALTPIQGLAATPRPVGVVDLHVDLPYQSAYRGHPFAEGTGQFPARELKRAGVLGVVLPLYIPRRVSPTGPRLEDLEGSYARIFSALLATPPYRLPGCVPSARSVSTWLAFEGAAPLAENGQLVAMWVARGLRLFGLVHSYDNALAGSSGTGAHPGTGLSEAGRRLVAEIHRHGGVVDVSHASDRSTDELIAISQKRGMPVVATHSNARALAPHPRNLSDAQLRGIAQTGGVVGVNFHQTFLARHGKSASLDDLVRHILHMVRVAGAAHVAIGSDFEGDIRPVPELGGTGGYQRLAAALKQAGLSDSDIARIFHRNALRVLCPSHPQRQ
jgi:membrane dipeptidase